MFLGNISGFNLPHAAQSIGVAKFGS